MKFRNLLTMKFHLDRLFLLSNPNLIQKLPKRIHHQMTVRLIVQFQGSQDASVVSGSEIDPAVIAAITAAVNQHRK